MVVYTLLDSVACPVLALSARDRRLRFWNAAFEDLSGLDRGQVLGRRPSAVLGSVARALETAAPGASVAVEGMGRVDLSAAGDSVILGTLQRAGGPDTDRERETFLGMVAHDLRTPLRNISFLCETLLDDPAPAGEATARTVGRIAAVSDAAMSLASEVIGAVQAAGLAPAPPAEVDLSALCNLLFGLLDPQGRHDLDCRAALVEAERAVLQTVLRNLIDNALRHGGRDRLTVSVDVRAAGAAGGITLTVADNGAGFATPALAFLSGGELRHDSGFGLMGLRRLVGARNGRLEVTRPETGTGSVIAVTLPGRLIGAGGESRRAS